MASTYSNDLRIELQTTGENAGTWGTKTNAALTQIAEAFSYGTKDCFAADANQTVTVPDGTADASRGLYLKVTSSATLTATRTLTLGPNTISRLMFIENATTGSQSIAISQGSGANVTIATAKTAVVYLDGAGSGAAVVDAMAKVDPGVTDTLAEVLGAGNTTGGTDIATTTTDKVQFRDSAIYINSSADGQLDIVADTEIQIAATTIDINGAINASGEIIAASLDISGDIDVDGTTNLDVVDIDGAVDMASTLQVDGAATFTTEITANGGIDVTGTIEGNAVTLKGNNGVLIKSVSSDNYGFYTSVTYTTDMAEIGALDSSDGSNAGSNITFNDYGQGVAVNTGKGVSSSAALLITKGNDISFYEDTGTTPKFFWDASAESLGIGTGSPSSLQAGAENLVVGSGSGDEGMTIYSGTASRGNIYFADGTTGSDLYRGQINYFHDSDYLRFVTAAIEAMRIDSSQNVTIPNGNLDVTGTATMDGLVVDGGATTTLKAGGFTANSVSELELAENRDGSNNLLYGFKFKTDGAGDNNFHLLRHSNSTTGNKALSVGRDTGDISFYEDTGTTPKLFWDASAESLGIGTSAPATALDVTGTVTADGLTVDGDAAINLSSTTGTTFGQKGGLELFSSSSTVGNGGELTWQSGTGSTETWAGISGYIVENNVNGSRGHLLFGTKSATTDTVLTERMRISDSGQILVQNGTAAAPTIAGTNDANTGLAWLNAGELSLIEDGNERVKVSGLGIDVTGGITLTTSIALPDGTSSNPSLRHFGDSDTGLYFPASNAVGFAAGGSRKFYVNSTTAYFENLSGGINLSSATVNIGDSGSGGVLDIKATSSGVFKLNGSEVMRILADGSVVQGNTVSLVASNYSNQAGAAWHEPDEHYEIATTGNRSALEIGKNNANDGNLVVFRKQGTTVGSIGTTSGTFWIGSGDTGLVFDNSTVNSEQIRPYDTSTGTRDAAIDLGAAGGRFKDLYLSGGVVFGPASGSTVSSETLSSYEEGTWTPEVRFGAASPVGITFSNRTGAYTKIGNVVQYTFYISLTSKGAQTGNFEVYGLPFAAASSDNGFGVASYFNGLTFSGDEVPIGRIDGAAVVEFRYAGSGNANRITNIQVENATDIRMSGTYKTA